jgi:hypothetical protein
MTLTPGGRYSIAYREHGEEKTALAHYRGFGTADWIARGDPNEPSSEPDGLHWFKVDGTPGYLSMREEDLVGYEIAEGHT